MTHADNLPYLLKFGITHKNSVLSNPNYIPIGDSSLIESRDAKTIFVTNGNLITSTVNDSITVGNYTPFYFGVRMPMLFVIQKGYNGVTSQNPENIVYCVLNLQEIIDSGLPFFFTDGHATNSFSNCYSADKINNVLEIVDFEAVFVDDWTTDRDLKRKKEAEILIYGDIPLSCISGYVCYNILEKRKLQDFGINENQIGIRPQYYF